MRDAVGGGLREGAAPLVERVRLLPEDVVGMRAEHPRHRLRRRPGRQDDWHVRGSGPKRPEQPHRVRNMEALAKPPARRQAREVSEEGEADDDGVAEEICG